jgi:hypothetical protein
MQTRSVLAQKVGDSPGRIDYGSGQFGCPFVNDKIPGMAIKGNSHTVHLFALAGLLSRRRVCGHGDLNRLQAKSGFLHSFAIGEVALDRSGRLSGFPYGVTLGRDGRCASLCAGWRGGV